MLAITLTTETALKLAPVAVGLLAIAVTLYVRWTGRRVHVLVDIREAWTPPAWPLAAVGGNVIKPPPGRPEIFDGSLREHLLRLGDK